MVVKVIEDSEAFEAALSAAGSKLVVVDFTAAWCGPCKVIAPKFEEMSVRMTTVVFLKVDVDEVAELVEKYGVECMPTFLFFKNGETIDKFSGANTSLLEEKITALK